MKQILLITFLINALTHSFILLNVFYSCAITEHDLIYVIINLFIIAINWLAFICC